jgi:hypothetical protein
LRKLADGHSRTLLKLLDLKFTSSLIVVTMTMTTALLLTPLLCMCALSQSAPPLACNTKAISAADLPRYQELVKRLRSAVDSRREFPDGYTFEVKGTGITLQELAEWMTMERRCCPFLTFKLETAGNRESFSLTLTGPAGVKSILDSALAFGPK